MTEVLNESPLDILHDLASSAINPGTHWELLEGITYASEPVKFSEAPNDTLLVVVSKDLSMTGGLRLEGKILDVALKGSLVLKASRKAKRMMFGTALGYGEVSRGKHLLHISTYYAAKYMSVDENIVTSLPSTTIPYRKDSVPEGLLIPLKDIMYLDKPLFNPDEPAEVEGIFNISELFFSDIAYNDPTNEDMRYLIHLNKNLTIKVSKQKYSWMHSIWKTKSSQSFEPQFFGGFSAAVYDLVAYIEKDWEHIPAIRDTTNELTDKSRVLRVAKI